KGNVVRIEPAAHMVADQVGVDLKLNQPLSSGDRQKLADKLADCLFDAFRREATSGLSKDLLVTPPLTSNEPVEAVVFSGGVSEYVYGRTKEDYGDLAIDLASAVRSRIDAGRLPAKVQPSVEGIRATVIGASQF